MYCSHCHGDTPNHSYCCHCYGDRETISMGCSPDSPYGPFTPEPIPYSPSNTYVFINGKTYPIEEKKSWTTKLITSLD